MRSKIALFVFALSVGVSATASPPDNLCYKIYNQCMADFGDYCADELQACLDS